MIHNPAMECMPREEMRKLQTERLIKTVKTCYEKVPFYKRKMDKMGIKPEDITSIDDITKLPFTTKYDLRDEYPFGLQAVPMSEVRRIHASSGTTGKPVVGTYTQNDLDNWAECVARVLAVGDIGPGDVDISAGASELASAFSGTEHESHPGFSAGADGPGACGGGGEGGADADGLLRQPHAAL